MKKAGLTFLTLLAMLVPLALLSLSEGDSIPPMNARFLDGSSRSLTAVCGEKHVILAFFDHNCAPCMREIPFLQGLLKGRPKLKVILVAAQMTDEAKARAFLDKIRKNSGTTVAIPVAMDRFGDIEDTFRVKAHPATFVVSRGCRIVARFQGASPENERKIEKALDALK